MFSNLSTPPRITRSMNHLVTPNQRRHIAPIPTVPRKANVRFSTILEEREHPESPSPPEIPVVSETIDFLSDANHKGFKVRYNKEAKLISVIDIGIGINGQNKHSNNQILRRLILGPDCPYSELSTK